MMVGKKLGQAAIERSGAARRGQAAIESAAPTAGALHAQAAMEYLMTYGWALLVIVIVIAILIIMNPFSAPQTCRFDSVGFACNNIAVTTTGTLLGGITNGNNNGIVVKGIVCTADKSSTVPVQPKDFASAKIARQGIYSFPAGASTISCGSGGAKGADFSGKVWVFYSNDEDDASYPVRTASANLITKFI
jgi:hypothetical protein